ncbi:FRG domain-containing protein [Staphylococcus epidermidis]|nr:FRG domain-containing protein [Staphylococcus epidermidis]MCG2283500.1 FRG domain-containing protein [Staphylococcus epidermidis]MEA1862843.1 FRG domain-containing protein [Staphylococcus epidermidis]
MNNYKLFNDIEIKIKITPNVSNNPYEFYEIAEITIDNKKSNNLAFNERITKIRDSLNKSMQKDKFHKKWKIFYLFKEFLQLLNEEIELNFNYYRGQSHSWPSLPGILRGNTNGELVKNFEQEYKRISYNYPKELKYIEYSSKNRIERSENLSILQHYGMKTSLLDITKNPFIALLFMVSETSKNRMEKPCIEFYEIDEEVHHEKHLFIRVSKDSNNKRIEAQKGAFLNFDHLISLKSDEIVPINRIRLTLDLDATNVIKNLKNDIDKLKQLIDELKNKDKEIEVFQGEIDKIENYLSEVETKVNSVEKEDFLSNCYENIRVEILKKLTEYYYYEDQLYPDLDKQIEFIQSKYNDESKKRFISNM